MVLFLIGSSTALTLVFSPVASQAASDLTPPPPSDALNTARLPDCALFRGTPVPDIARAGAQLGWGPGKPSALIAPGTWSAQITPMIPCQGSGGIVMNFYSNIMSGDPQRGYAKYLAVAVLYCVDPSTGVTSTDTKSEAGSFNTQQSFVLGTQFPNKTVANCPFISKITVKICGGWPYCDNLQPEMNAVWLPQQWNSADSGFQPATSAAQVGGQGIELPIRCNIDNTGADIVAITQNVVASIVNWFPCILIPVGWDRAGRISYAWNTGPVGQLTGAYRAAVPNNISCGAVGSIPFFGRVISFDTCGADFAPGFVKTVLGWLIVLGTCTVIVRRIMWSVGSKG